MTTRGQSVIRCRGRVLPSPALPSSRDSEFGRHSLDALVLPPLPVGAALAQEEVVAAAAPRLLPEVTPRWGVGEISREGRSLGGAQLSTTPRSSRKMRLLVFHLLLKHSELLPHDSILFLVLQSRLTTCLQLLRAWNSAIS